jgi:hypothetical protein
LFFSLFSAYGYTESETSEQLFRFRSGLFEPSETFLSIPREILNRSFPFTFLQHLALCDILREISSLANSPDKIGILCGSATGGIQKLADQFNRLHQKGFHQMSPLTVPLTIHNSSSSVLAIEHNLRGISSGYHCMETSGIEAFCDGIAMLKSKEFDSMVIGAGEDLSFESLPFRQIGGVFYLSNLPLNLDNDSIAIECLINRGKPWLSPEENLVDILKSYFGLTSISKKKDTEKAKKWIYFNFQKAKPDIFKDFGIDLISYPQFMPFLSMGPLLGLSMGLKLYEEFKILVISSEGHSVLISCKK